MDAGFLNVGEIGQYFMTKDTVEFSQFTDAVACRGCTLPRDEEASQPKGWIRGNTRIGPVLEVTTCCLQDNYGVEIRIMFMNKDNPHSWVRISYGLNKLVTNLNNEQDTSEVQFEEYALKLNASDFACRSKAKAKPKRREPVGSSTKTIPFGERIWTDVEPGEYSISDYEVSKKLLKFYQTLQDNVLIPNNFFKYIDHVGCAINLHSINSGLIPGGQHLSNRQTVFFLPVDAMDKNHKDPDTIDLNAPRHAQYMHKPWKRHQNAVYWVDINLVLKKKLKFHQTRSNAIILHETLPAYCIPKGMETGEVICEKVFASRRPPPKIYGRYWTFEQREVA